MTIRLICYFNYGYDIIFPEFHKIEMDLGIRGDKAPGFSLRRVL